MTSKAEKKRQKKAASARQRQGAGRPRQAGERYPSGKLKPRKNDRVIEAKRALVGAGMDIALAEDPLDFIHAKGWLTLARYRSALTYRDARRRARVGAPRLDTGGLAETSSTTGVWSGSFAEMTDQEITTVFDHVFRDPPAMSADEREAQALQRWKALEAAMSPGQRREVGLIVLEKSWSFWITALNLGHTLTGRQQQQRQALEAGLDAMARVLRRRVDAVPAAPPYEAMPDPRPRKVEEQLRYVDEAGEPVAMASEKGLAFDIVRRRRA